MTAVTKKQLGLLGILSLYSLLCFLLVISTYQGADIVGFLSTTAAIVGFGLVALLAASSFMLMNHDRYSHIAAAIAPVVVWIVGGFSVAALVGAGLLLLLTLAAQRSIFKTSENLVRLHTVSVFRVAARLILAGVLIAVLSLLFPVVQEKAQAGDFRLGSSAATTIIEPLVPLIRQFRPQYSVSTTVDDIINQHLDEERRNLPPGYTLPDDAADQVRATVSDQLNIPLAGQETIPEVLSSLVNQYVTNLAQGGGIIMSLVLLLVALLAIRTVLPIFVWPIIGLIAAMLWLFEKSGFITRHQVDITADRIQL